MNLQVLLEIAATGELLVAELAGERLLSRVYSLVADQVRDLRKRLLAPGVLAAIGLCLVVHASMLLQR